jgi:RNase P subunit RPR2
MPVNQLPPVAKSFFTFCKKCNADRYHVVLAHTTSKTAKIKCEVCGSQKSYSLPKAAGSTGKAKVTRPRAGSETARRSSHNAEYETLLNTHEKAKETSYSIKAKFKMNEKINHPKFGIGIVRDVQPEKVEVVFADEVRNLVHNRE